MSGLTLQNKYNYSDEEMYSLWEDFSSCLYPIIPTSGILKQQQLIK